MLCRCILLQWQCFSQHRFLLIYLDLIFRLPSSWAQCKLLLVTWFISLLYRGVAKNNYLGGPGCNRDILRWWFFSPLYRYFISRLIWTGYKIKTLNFILFVDSEFIYLFTWSWITVYPFRFNSWTFGGMLIRHWSINIYFYRSPKFWMTNILFVKNK